MRSASGSRSRASGWQISTGTAGPPQCPIPWSSRPRMDPFRLWRQGSCCSKRRCPRGPMQDVASVDLVWWRSWRRTSCPPSEPSCSGCGRRAGGSSPSSTASRAATRNRCRPWPDVLAVWGEPQAAYHRSAGPPGLRVEAVGWPRLESSVTLAPPTGDDAWDLLHFSQPSEDLSAGGWPEAHLHALQMVEDYARRHPHRRVAVKLHPSSRANGFAPPPIRHAHIVTAELLALIRSTRIVLVVSSTTGIEAMSLGRPVLQVPPRGYVGPNEFEFIGESGAARRVDLVEALAAATEDLLSNTSAYGDAVESGRAVCSLVHHWARATRRGRAASGRARRRAPGTREHPR